MSRTTGSVRRRRRREGEQARSSSNTSGSSDSSEEGEAMLISSGDSESVTPHSDDVKESGSTDSSDATPPAFSEPPPPPLMSDRPLDAPSPSAARGKRPLLCPDPPPEFPNITDLLANARGAPRFKTSEAGLSGSIRPQKPPNVPCIKVPFQGRGTVSINDERRAANERSHEFAIVGRMFGRKIPFSALKPELERRWLKIGPFHLRSMSEDTFLCSFSSAEARDRVLDGCPWVIAGQLIGVDRWRPSFRVGSEAPFLSPVWIRLPYLPLAFWDNDNLSRIAQSIGEPICIDGVTAALDRIEYARICVRVDLSRRLLLHTRISSALGDFDQPIIYEHLHSLCFRCGSTSHKVSECGQGRSFAQMVSSAPGVRSPSPDPSAAQAPPAPRAPAPSLTGPQVPVLSPVLGPTLPGAPPQGLARFPAPPSRIFLYTLPSTGPR